MAVKVAFISFIACFMPIRAIAQKVRLINSTERHWSGGIAGRSGTDYTFSVGFTGFKKEPVLDSLWIGDAPVILTIGSNTAPSRQKGTFRYDITARTQRDEYEERHPLPPGEKQQQKPRAPRRYKGVALLSYTYKGTRNYFEINKIMKTYPQVSYP
jgi:hypothetical protein